MTLDVLGVVTLSGSLGFELGPTTEVTLADGTTKELKILTIGAANVYGFIGFNGPYVHDSNGNGYIDRGDFATNPDGSLGAPLAFNDGLGGRPKAIGFAINDLDLGIFVGHRGRDRRGRRPAAEPRRLRRRPRRHRPVRVRRAPRASPPSAASAPRSTSARAPAAASAPIDFVTSFPDSRRRGRRRRRSATRSSPATRTTRSCSRYDDFLFKLELVGASRCQDVFALVGFFSLEVDSQGLKLLDRRSDGHRARSRRSYNADAPASIPPRARRCSRSRRSARSSSTAAASPSTSTSTSTSQCSGLDLCVSARVLLNTTGVTQQIAFPIGSSTSSTTIAIDGRWRRRAASPLAASLDLLDRLGPAARGTERVLHDRRPGAEHPRLDHPLQPAQQPGRADRPPRRRAVRGRGDVRRLRLPRLRPGRGRRRHRPQHGRRRDDRSSSSSTSSSRSARRASSSTFAGRRRDRAVAGGRVHRRHVALDADITSLFHLDVSGDLTIDTRPAGTANDYFILEPQRPPRRRRA